MQPTFSVIVPAYNRAKFLPRCINSLLNQTFTDWELLIVDDGSTDNTAEIVKAYEVKDKRIKYIYQQNQKVSAARNTGLENAKGKFLCFLDSDDEYDNGHLSFFYSELEKRNFGNFFLSTGFVYKDGTSEQVCLSPKPKSYEDAELGKIMKAYLPFSPCVQTICLPGFIKDKVKFDKRLYLSECYDFCARAAALVDDVIFFPLTTVTLYGHTDNASVPTDINGVIKFNSRQYEEFLLMKEEPFYNKISKTNAFKRRLFFLQFELAKSALQQKQPVKFAGFFSKAMWHNPTYLLTKNYGQLFKKVIRKFQRKFQAAS